MARAVKARIQSGELVEAEFATMVKNIYGCAMSPKAGLLYAEIIAEETSLLFTALANLTNLEMKTSEVIESSSKYRKAPMKSLRDIDVQLELEIKKARTPS